MAGSDDGDETAPEVPAEEPGGKERNSETKRKNNQPHVRDYVRCPYERSCCGNRSGPLKA